MVLLLVLLVFLLILVLIMIMILLLHLRAGDASLPSKARCRAVRHDTNNSGRN